MASAIWSAAPAEMLSYPASAFIRFHDNHGLLSESGGVCTWETVVGCSRNYVDCLTGFFADKIRLHTGVEVIRRVGDGVVVSDSRGGSERFDHGVVACHADQSPAVLAKLSPEENSLLGAFRCSRNLAVLDTDKSLLPNRRALWSSWNYIVTASATPCA